MSLVTVIIPSYNSAKLVCGAVDSILTQSFQDFEVIIVDDGSEDDTGDVIRPYLSDSRIRYIYQSNLGLPSARNAGAKRSRGDYLAFLDADDFLATNALEAMLEAFWSTGAAWLNVGVLKFERNTQSIRRPFIPPGDLLGAILDDDFITRSPFYPREEFFSMGMYDEEMRNREDWDMHIRMVRARRPLGILDEPLYHYTRTEGSITTGNRRTLCAYTEKLLRKHHKRLADAGSREISLIYARNMWNLAREYFYEIRDYRKGLRCMFESIRYDRSISRPLNALFLPK